MPQFGRCVSLNSPDAHATYATHSRKQIPRPRCLFLPDTTAEFAPVCAETAQFSCITSTQQVQEVDDGIWLVTFMDYDLGYIDLEEKTCSP
jgi:hypothetical protein